MSAAQKKTGVLLVNLGTPDSAEPEAVGRYLREFLMDPLVVDIHKIFRWILVHWLIIPRRAHASAKLYKKVWHPHRGSPLLSYSLELTERVGERLQGRCPVVLGMRYGNPAIAAAVENLMAQGVTRILAFPLYPQYSLAATESSILEIKRVIKNPVEVEFLPAFFQDEKYLSAVTSVSAPYLEKNPYDQVLFSFHGLPERQVRKTDPSGTYCLASADCCQKSSEYNKNCYRHQCYVTAQKLAERLQIPADKYEVCFQSRLGRTPWIKPYTDFFYEAMPAKGVRRILVLCPSFVADCLETLEEVQIRGQEQFVAAGGESLKLVPSLNCEPAWIDTVVDWIEKRL